MITLAGFPLTTDMEFTGWLQNTASPAPGVPAPKDLGCSGIGPCRLTLNEDVTILGNYWPANRIRLGRLRRNLNSGGGELLVTLPAPGVLSVAGNQVRGFRDSNVEGGTVRVPLVPRSLTARKLARSSKAKAKLWIRFRPAGGRGRTEVRVVTLRKR